MPSNASAAFTTLMGSVDQLITIHGNLQSGRGRRHEQDALHRAGVVMAVAAWQAYIEKVLSEALDAIFADIQNPGVVAPRWAIHTFLMRRAEVMTDIKKFNTPNDVNVRDLLVSALGFNPWPSWEWRQGPRQWTTDETRQRTNAWIQVRHSVAHGFELPANVDWLQDGNGHARLTLGLLKECRKHFVFLVAKTDNALSDHLIQAHHLVAPW